MIPIPNTTIEKVLEIYKPEARYLLSAELEPPRLKGLFKIGSCHYVTIPSMVTHATDIEIQLCLNQLAYAGIAEALKRRAIPELREIPLDVETQCNSMLIIESRKRFRRPIRTDKEISGTLTLKDWKDYDSVVLGFIDFQFENKSCIGKLELALVKQGEIR